MCMCVWYATHVYICFSLTTTNTLKLFKPNFSFCIKLACSTTFCICLCSIIYNTQQQRYAGNIFVQHSKQCARNNKKKKKLCTRVRAHHTHTNTLANKNQQERGFQLCSNEKARELNKTNNKGDKRGDWPTIYIRRYQKITKKKCFC